MAIAFNNASDLGNNGGTTNSLTGSHTNSGSNPYTIVGFAGGIIGTDPDDISSVVANGSVSASLLAKITSTAGTGQRYGYVYGYPSLTGTYNIVITAGSNHYLQGGATSYTGVKQTGQPDASTTNSATGTTCTTGITPVNANSWAVLLEGGYDGGTPPVAGSGATRRTFDAINGAWGLFDSNSALTAGVNYNMTTTRGSDPFSLGIAHVVVTLQPDTGGVAITYPELERAIRGLARGLMIGGRR